MCIEPKDFFLPMTVAHVALFSTFRKRKSISFRKYPTYSSETFSFLHNIQKEVPEKGLPAGGPSLPEPRLMLFFVGGTLLVAAPF